MRMCSTIPRLSMFLAKALFDNVAECPEELAFRRGDVITVMAEHTGHQPGGHRLGHNVGGGWWLCSFRGQQGLAPANRLKILSGLVRPPPPVRSGKEEEEKKDDENDKTLELENQEKTDLPEQINDTQQDYDVPPTRLPHQYRTKCNDTADVSLYDTPFHASKASGTDITSLSTRNPPGIPLTSTVNSLMSKLPVEKRSSTERNLHRRSIASVESLFSNPFRAVSHTGGQHQMLFHQMPPNRKRWSAESGSLMFSHAGKMGLPREYSRDCRSSETEENHKLSEKKNHWLAEKITHWLPEKKGNHEVCEMKGNHGLAEKGIHGLAEKRGIHGLLDRKGNHELAKKNSKNELSEMKGIHGLAECREQYQIPPKRQGILAGSKPYEDQSIYSVPSSSQPAKMTAQVTYDVPNLLTTALSPDFIAGTSLGTRVSTASEDSYQSGNSSRAVSTVHDALCAAASVHGHSPSGEVSVPRNSSSRLSFRQSCASEDQLSLYAGSEDLYDIPASCSLSPSIASSSPLVSDRISRDGLHDNSNSNRNLEQVVSSCHHSLCSNASEVSLKCTSGSLSNVGYQSGAIYNVPPQASRNSTLSAGSVSSNESFRLSSCSTDSSSGGEYYTVVKGMCEESQLDADTATQLLMKCQEDVTTWASRVLELASSSCCTGESVQSNFSNIKTACSELKNALITFLDFAHGAQINCSQLSDRRIVSQLLKQVSHVHKHLKYISDTLECLGDVLWQVTTLAEPLTPDRQDHLDRVIHLAKDLPPDVNKLVSLIHGNSSLIFKKRSSDATAYRSGSEAAPVTPVSRLHTSEAAPQSLHVQQRPLPSVPVSSWEITVPPASVDRMRLCQASASSRSSLDEEIGALEEDTGRCSIDTDNESDRDYSELQDEYDYVQLEAYDPVSQINGKIWQQQHSENIQRTLKSIDEEAELPDMLTKNKKNSSVTVSYGSTLADKATEPIRHTDKMFAWLGERYGDTNIIPANKQLSELKPACDDQPNTTKVEHHPLYLTTQTCNTNRSQRHDIQRPQSVSFTVPNVTPLDPFNNNKKQTLLDSGTVGVIHTPTLDLYNNNNSSNISNNNSSSSTIDCQNRGMDSNSVGAVQVTDSVTKSQATAANLFNKKQEPNSSGVGVIQASDTASDSVNVSQATPPLDPGDRQVLSYYWGQVDTHCTLMANAIHTFIAGARNHDPPRAFISNSKFVVVSAYRLLYIGDALQCSLVDTELLGRVEGCADQMCECLRVFVQATKAAALQYPSLTAVQRMLDTVKDVSRAAHQLRMVILQASSSS